jgi:predicted protein tyrosine phosphatase
LKLVAVCPLSKLNETLASSGAKRVISLLSSDTQIELPEGISKKDHLILRFNDIVEPKAGLVSPSEQHVLELVKFAQEWDWATPLLIHCWAGISRSPAAAAVVALALTPAREDQELAFTMRGLSGSITPNIMMINIADRLLNRGNRFTQAFRSIGRGEDAFEGNPFLLQL